MKERVDFLEEQNELISLDYVKIRVLVISSTGKALTNIIVDGITTKNGDPISTNEFGYATGYAKSGSVTIRLTKYADLTSDTQILDTIKANKYETTLTITANDFYKTTGSSIIRFSKYTKAVSYSLCGGGGGGGYGGTSGQYVEPQFAGAGGGGGYVTTGQMVPEPNKEYKCSVGSGGSAGWTDPGGPYDQNRMQYWYGGGEGGRTSFGDIVANGGNGGGIYASRTYSLGQFPPEKVAEAILGGVGNGNGGNGSPTSTTTGTNGGPGSGYIYNSSSTQIACGGGGGGGTFLTGINDGGSPNGAKTRENGGFPGGGGGGASANNTNGGSGGNGGIGLRIILDSEMF